MASKIIFVTEVPTVSLLYKLGRLQQAPTLVSNSSSIRSLNDKIGLLRHDITKLKVDCIVNAANESLLGGGGVDGAIHVAAGRELLAECQKLGGCRSGSAKITNAYKLPCKKIIHAVGPRYSMAKQTNTHTSLLQGCYRTSLELAVDHGMGSIAFPALSTGIYGYPSLEAARVALGEVSRFLRTERGQRLEKVVFCNFQMQDVSAYEKLIPEFFPPPSERKAELRQSNGNTAEVAGLPSAPTNEPLGPGQPRPKKQRLDDDSQDDDWTEVEAPAPTAKNGSA
ncbi:MAG: hypothetical protein M1825_000926 [Sarcosagium campestre]|nr:MAG: hypothetical protein M1825_000926 [Sarcosagium campestre]